MSEFFIIFVLFSIAALAAFVAGMIKPQTMVFWSANKSRRTACLYLIPFALFAAIAGTVFLRAQTPEKALSSLTVADTISSSQAAVSSPRRVKAANKSTKVKKTDLKTFHTELISGFYTAGIDFPAGTYKISVKKGTGTVTAADGSVNLKMSAKSSDATYQKEVKDIVIHNGTVLSVSGVTVKLVSKEKMDKSVLKRRNNSAVKSYRLSPGSYPVGSKIEAGTYDLYLLKGEGNIMTEDGRFSAPMGKNLKQYKHVALQSGQTLKISGAVLKMNPSR